MKRLMSILLALALTMAIAVPVMAAGETTTVEPTTEPTAPVETTPEETTPEETESTETILTATTSDMTYYVGGYGAVPHSYKCHVGYEGQGFLYGEFFYISYGDPIVENWPTEAGTYTVTFDKTTTIEGAGDTEYTFNVSMNITVLELPALSGQCGETMNWSFDKDSYTLTISGTGDMYAVVESHEDYIHFVYAYEPGWWKLPVKHIVVEEGVETLSDYAFTQTSSVTQTGSGYSEYVESIQLPSSLQAIPEVLSFGENLKTLSVPEGITELGGWLIGNPGSSFGDLDNLYLPSTLTKLDMATVILAGISEGSKIETTPDFPIIYFAGTQEQWDAIELVETIHIESGENVLDNAYLDQLFTSVYGKTTADLFAEVTVVCTGKEEVTVENGTATVPDSSVEITEGEDVVIDVTDTEEEVSSVVIGSETVDKLADAETSVEIKLSDATVSFDKTAIGSISQQAGENAVTVVAKEVEESTLTAEQKAALEGKEVCLVLTLEAFAGETKITDFGGGKVTISVPFTLPEGKAGTDFYVAYVAEDGTITAMPTTYADGVLTFTTTHFSSYVVLENKTVAPADPSNPKTGDNSHLFLLVALMVVSTAALVVCTTKRKAF